MSYRDQSLGGSCSTLNMTASMPAAASASAPSLKMASRKRWWRRTFEGEGFQWEIASVQIIVMSIVVFGALGVHNAVTQGTVSTKEPSVSFGQVIVHSVSVLFSFLVTPFICQICVRQLTLIGVLLSLLNAVLETMAVFWGGNALEMISAIGSGLSYSVMWVTLHATMLGYSTHDDRALHISICWTSIHVGGAINALVNMSTSAHVNFTIMISLVLACGTFSLYSCFLLAEPALVVKSDGTYANTYKLSSIGSVTREFLTIFRVMRSPAVLLYVPTVFSSIWNRPLQHDYITAADAQTGNSAYVLYYVTSSLTSWILPLQFYYLRSHTIYLLSMALNLLSLLLTTVVVYTSHSAAVESTTSGVFVSYGLMIIMGLSDSILSCHVLWMIGSLAENDSRKCVKIGSFFQGIQSLAGLVTWAWTFGSDFTLKRHCWITLFLYLISIPLGVVTAQRYTTHANLDDESNGSFYSLYVPT